MLSRLGIQKYCPWSIKSESNKLWSLAKNASKVETSCKSLRFFSLLSCARKDAFQSCKKHLNDKHFQIQNQIRNITKLTSFNVVDNSKLGQKTRRYKQPYLIGFYRKRKTADIGDVIKVAVQGRPCKALVVATRKPKPQPIPRFDNNNIVLLDDNLAPLGTRIKGPIPAILRKKRDKFSKVIAIASRFV